jgi:hypothetical protein
MLLYAADIHTKTFLCVIIKAPSARINASRVLQVTIMDEGSVHGMRDLPTSYISRKERAASFFGVLIPFASSFGMIELRPKPESQDSIYFMVKSGS